MNYSNKKTIEAYESNINEYVQNTLSTREPYVREWIDKSTQGLQPDAKILEIGAGYGRDAKYTESKGFHVEKTDAVEGFVEILKQNDPTSHLLNIITDDIGADCDLIMANAVLLHLTDDETKSASSKVFNALKAGGVFALSLKQGEGDTWQSTKGMASRYFNYWSKEDIVNLLSDTGFVNIDAWLDASDSPNATWIMIIAKKP